MSEDISLLGDAADVDVTPEPSGQDQVHILRGDDKQTFEKPEDVPDEYWDKETGAYKGDDLIKALKAEQQKSIGLRQKLSKGHQNVPQEASAYQVQLADEVDIGDDDEGLELFRNIAFKNNLSQEQFNGVVAEFFNAYKDGNLGTNDNEEDEEAEQQRAEEYAAAEKAKLGEYADQAIANAKSLGRTLIQSGVLSEELLPDYMDMARNANQVKILNIFRDAMGYKSDIPTNLDNLVPGQESESAILQIMRDPTYETDLSLQKKVADYYKRNYSS